MATSVKAAAGALAVARSYTRGVLDAVSENVVLSQIMSGSCTPACDLEAAVARGDVSANAAEAAYHQQFPALSVAGGAQLERDHMKWLDV